MQGIKKITFKSSRTSQWFVTGILSYSFWSICKFHIGDSNISGNICSAWKKNSRLWRDHTSIIPEQLLSCLWCVSSKREVRVESVFTMLLFVFSYLRICTVGYCKKNKRIFRSSYLFINLRHCHLNRSRLGCSAMNFL